MSRQAQDDWRRRDQAAKVLCIRSTTFAFPSGEEHTMITQAEIAEGDRLLTYMYWHHMHRLADQKPKAKKKKKKDKDSKAPAGEGGEDEDGDEDASGDEDADGE